MANPNPKLPKRKGKSRRLVQRKNARRRTKKESTPAKTNPKGDETSPGAVQDDTAPSVSYFVPSEEHTDEIKLSPVSDYSVDPDIHSPIASTSHIRPTEQHTARTFYFCMKHGKFLNSNINPGLLQDETILSQDRNSSSDSKMCVIGHRSSESPLGEEASLQAVPEAAPSASLSQPHEQATITLTLPPSELQMQLEKVRDTLSTLLPAGWLAAVYENGIQVGCRAVSKLFVVQRCLFVAVDGTCLAAVHGRFLPGNHPFWQNIRLVPLDLNSVDDFISNVIAMTAAFRALEICRGVESFRPLWERAEDCFTDRNEFLEPRITETCRSNNCALLISGLRCKRCLECQKLWKKLYQRNSVRSKLALTAPKKKAIKNLTTGTPDKGKRSKTSSKIMASLKKKNERLTKKVAELVNEEGVHVDIDREMADYISKAQEGLTDVQKLFIKEQIKAAAGKGFCGVRWHQSLIRNTVSLRNTSLAAYEELSGILRWQSERQLYNGCAR